MRSSPTASDDGLADEETPFIRNAWYVACFSRDIPQGTPFARRILGENVMLYRKSDGSVAAMKDRCPHRSFPLSAGTVDGDDIVCGYHGIRFGADGACKLVPTQGSAPRALRVPVFSVAETAPIVWIWMGDADCARQTPLPPAPWMLDDSGWATSCDYLKVEASYVFLHENLLDLSHLTFLHAKTFGTPDYATAPFETEVTDEAIIVRRTVQPTRLPPIYANPLKMQGVAAARIVTSTFLSPGLSISAVVLRNLEQREPDRIDHHIRTAQLVTPCDRSTVHYHFVVARDFVTDDKDVSEFILAGVKAAFAEDVFALESIARVRKEDPDARFAEKSITSDRAGVMLRRRLLMLAAKEDRDRCPHP
jgi:phenylpropionate dioxygenase-like ring-hydroxylating dioxygenase large terminal subunit